MLTDILNREETKAKRGEYNERFRCVKFDGLMGNFTGEGLFTQETTRLERDSEVSIWVITEAMGITVQSKNLGEYSKEQSK